MALDRTLWDYARSDEFLIVTKDADYSEIGTLLGFPPKVVWIRRGNCTTNEIEILIRNNQGSINKLNNDPDTGILMLF